MLIHFSMMCNTHLVSVVIPCFNSVRFVERALKSVYSQTYRNLELIIVDNGSSDGTAALVEELIKESPFPWNLALEPIKGACAARNKGLEKAKGSWVQFLDADDELLPDKIEKDLLAISLGKECALLLGGVKVIDSKGDVRKIVKVKVEDFWLNLMRSKLGQTSGMLWRIDAVKAVGGWNVSMTSSQEYDLIFRIVKSGFGYVVQDEPNTLIYMIEGSISHDKSKQASNWRNFVELRKLMHDEGIKHDSNLSEYLNSALFDAVRIWYNFDSKSADQFFNLNFEKDFKPIRSQATSMLYVRLFKILGFKRTQSIFRLIRRLKSRK